jgi:hypothetical protein
MGPVVKLVLVPQPTDINLLRWLSLFALPSSDWTDAELLAYNISIVPTSPAVFFQSSTDPSLDHIDPHILTSPLNADNPNISNIAAEYLGYLDLATNAAQESSIDDFAAATLRLLGFNDRHSTVATRYNIPLTICGENWAAQTDVCVVYRPTTILLVLVEGKTLFNRANAEAQMVAEAIAAFQFNNTKRVAKGQPVLEAMTIPCITMVGTNPTFYLVPVTKELSDAVMVNILRPKLWS